MKHLSRWLIACTLVLLLVVLSQSNGAVPDPITAAGGIRFNEGTIAPGFIIESLPGDQVRLEDFRSKVVLLNFWATW